MCVCKFFGGYFFGVFFCGLVGLGFFCLILLVWGSLGGGGGFFNKTRIIPFRDAAL